MYIPRTLWCLAIIVALSYGSFLSFVEDVGSYAIFGEKFSDVEEKVVNTWGKVKNFYEHHKKLILAGEILLLAGTGLGEAGMLELVVDVFENGGVEALIDGTVEATDAAATGLRTFANGMYETLKAVKSLPSLETVYDTGEATLDLLAPLMEKFATETVLDKFALTSAQLLILVTNLIATSGSHINKPELACKTENTLNEYMKRAVDARLDSLVAPNDFADAVTFYDEVRKIKNKPYNKHGYNTTKDVRCYGGDHDKCFTDRSLRSNEKRKCSSYKTCYGDYAAKLRHTVEKAFPKEIIEKTCRNTITQDQIDGNFIINTTCTIFNLSPRKKVLINVFLLCSE